MADKTPKTQKELVAALTELGVELTGDEKVKELKALYDEAKSDDADEAEDDDADAAEANDEDEDEPETPVAPAPAPDQFGPEITDRSRIGERGNKPTAKLDPKSAPVSKLIELLNGPGVTVDKVARGGREEIMLRHLAAQVLAGGYVRTMIPIEAKEKRGVAFETAILNGLRFNILKGFFVELPEQVADIITASYHGAQTALEEMRADRSEKVEDALE